MNPHIQLESKLIIDQMKSLHTSQKKEKEKTNSPMKLNEVREAADQCHNQRHSIPEQQIKIKDSAQTSKDISFIEWKYKITIIQI